MIVVTGATGKLGRLVIESLLLRVPAAEITAAVRDPGQAADFAKRGVDVRRADYDEQDTLDAAIEGADRVLLISSNNPQRSVAQHATVIDAVKRAGVALLAYTSLWHADTATALPAVPHRETEPLIRAAGVPFTMLRNNLYTEQFAPQVRQAAASGTLTGTGQGRVASATHADYAAAAVAVLTGDGHEGKVYELGGDTSWSLPELAAEISRAARRDVVYQDVPPEQYRELLIAAGLPSLVADAALDTRRAIAEGEFAGTSAVLSGLIGRPTTPLADAVAAFLKN
ncbi:MAG: SDR family oxidoreductase [Trebonia sp.]